VSGLDQPGDQICTDMAGTADDGDSHQSAGPALPKPAFSAAS
jgi:hypothetical protein